MNHSGNISEYTFGQLLSHLLSVSKQKSYVLAGYLNYDVSYISKWVTGSMLPATKHANSMCREIATFIVDNTDEVALDELMKIFSVTDGDELLSAINQALLNSYRLSGEKNGKSKAVLVSEENNSRTVINPRLQKLYIKFNPEQTTTGDVPLKFNIAMMVDLLTLGKEDKMSIAKMDKDSPFTKLIGEIHYLISLCEDNIDPGFDALMFTYLLENYGDLDLKLSDYKRVPCSIMLAIKDYCLHTSIVSQNHRAIMSDICYDKSVANEMYDTIIASEYAFTKPMVKRTTLSHLIRHKKYLSLILSTQIRIYMSKIDEFLIPDDLFEELITQLDPETNDIEEIRTLHMMGQSIFSTTDIKVAVLDRCLHDYSLDGVLDFYGTPLTVTAEQRERHLKYVVDLLKDEASSLQLTLIDSAVLKDFDSEFAPCIYHSDFYTYVRLRSCQDYDTVNVIEASSLKKLYDYFFEYTFEKDAEELQVSMVRLSTYLKMLQKLKK